MFLEYLHDVFIKLTVLFSYDLCSLLKLKRVFCFEIAKVLAWTFGLTFLNAIELKCKRCYFIFRSKIFV